MSDLNAYDFSDEYYSDEDDYPSSYPPQTKDLEVDAEEDVGALADALELNTKLKEIMSSGLDPVSMQEELNRLMSGMQVIIPRRFLYMPSVSLCRFFLKLKPFPPSPSSADGRRSLAKPSF